MTHQHNTRNQRPEGSMFKKKVQYAFFAVICIWLLYQIHHSLYIQEYGCGNIEDKFRDERIVKALGRKGGASMSLYAEEFGLYGVDLIKEADRIRNVTDDGDQLDQTSVEVNGEDELSDWSILGKFSSKQGEIAEKIVSIDDNLKDEEDQSDADDQTEVKDLTSNTTVHTKTNTSITDVGEKLFLEKLSNEDEDLESKVRVSAVILKEGETSGVFRFNDENGIPGHDSSPSRRSNIQVGSFLERSNSSAGNNSKDMEACQKLCLQNVAEKLSLNKYEGKAANEEISEMSVVQSRKGSMRELLFQINS